MPPTPSPSLWRLWRFRLGIFVLVAVALYSWVQVRARHRNREIAFALLRIYQHVETRVPLPSTDPAMVALLEGLSRWNVGSPHFNVGGYAAEVEYQSRIGPFHWSRSDILQRDGFGDTLWTLSQTHTLIEPRFRWLGSQTATSRLLTITNDIDRPHRLSPVVVPR